MKKINIEQRVIQINNSFVSRSIIIIDVAMNTIDRNVSFMNMSAMCFSVFSSRYFRVK